MGSFIFLLLVSSTALLFNGSNGQAPINLRPLNVHRNFVTLSGYSSGGMMAQYLFVSHSSLFSGLGVFQHTFYSCGSGALDIDDWDRRCTILPPWTGSDVDDPRLGINFIREYARRGLIDPVSNIQGKPLYVFAAGSGWLFTREMNLRVGEVFAPFINNPPSIVNVVLNDANLTFPSNRADLPPCSGPSTQTPHQVSNCGYNGALEALKWILQPTPLVTPNANPGPPSLPQPLQEFDQSEFFDPLERADMDETGFVYIPTICKSGEVQCLLHFYFHGCWTGRRFVSNTHIVNSGYLEVAEANGIIMVFPQAYDSAENRIGCWDTFGFTGRLFATQRGAQVKVVKRMLDRITGVTPPTSPAASAVVGVASRLASGGYATLLAPTTPVHKTRNRAPQP